MMLVFGVAIRDKLMTRVDVEPGMRVTVRTEVRGYSAGLKGRPDYRLNPGEVATVIAVGVPSLVPGESSYAIVQWLCTETGQVERAAVHYANLELVDGAR